MFLTLMMNLSTIKGKISLSSDDREVTLWNFELWPWEDQVSLLNTLWYYSNKICFDFNIENIFKLYSIFLKYIFKLYSKTN